MAGIHRRRFVVQQDVVEVVAKKLKGTASKAIDQTLIVKTQEKMRLLEVKANQTKLPHDSKELRAAILLDYVAREEKGIRLDHKDLMQAVGMNGKNKQKFSALYDMIGNYLKPEGTKQELPKKRDPTRCRQSTQQQQQQQQQQKLPEGPQESTIPRLAIRLSSLIPDPNGFALKAKNLFEAMEEYVHTLENPRRVDQLTDIQRFRTLYEAACLYHVVAQTQTKKLSRMSKQQSKKQAGLQQKEMEELNRPLEIEDILNASPNFSDRDFTQVCKHMETLVTEMEQAEEKSKKKRKAKTDSKTEAKRQQQGKKGRKRGRKSANADSQSGDNPTKNRKNSKEAEAANESEPLAKKRGAARTVEVDIPSLEDWRKQVMEDSCSAAMKDMAAKGVPDEEMTKAALLEAAADDVLRRFGLVQ